MGVDIFSMALDALMIVAITGLWIMWFLQAGQRKKVEKMLLQASDDLKEATKLLDQVMGALAEQNGMQAPEKERPEIEDKIDMVAADDIALPSHEMEPEHKHGKRNSAEYSAQIMRLNREGLSEAEISEKLNVPAAQVKLMLLLQAPKV